MLNGNSEQYKVKCNTIVVSKAIIKKEHIEWLLEKSKWRLAQNSAIERVVPLHTVSLFRPEPTAHWSPPI